MNKLFTAIVMAAGLLIGLSLLFSFPVYLLWNGALVGAVDGIKEIGWLQAWGIMLLCGLLFKNTNAPSK